MIAFLTNNIATLLVGAIVLSIVVLISVKMIKDKKSGKKTCSSCSGCSGCPSAGICHRN